MSLYDVLQLLVEKYELVHWSWVHYCCWTDSLNYWSRCSEEKDYSHHLVLLCSTCTRAAELSLISLHDPWLAKHNHPQLINSNSHAKNVHDWLRATPFIPTHAPRPLCCTTPTVLPRARLVHLPKFKSPFTHTGSSGYWDTMIETMMDTQLLDCLFEINSQQQDWGKEGYQENREETCQGQTIAITETHAAGEISCSYFLTPCTFFLFSLLCSSSSSTSVL